MFVSDDEIRKRLRLGEDSYWEFKQFEFRGDRPANPERNDLADELISFANARGGKLLCGVSDNGSIQGMSESQLRAVSVLLAEVSTDSIEPALRIDVQHRQLDGKNFILAEVPKGESVHERSGTAFIRVGNTKRQMHGDERMRLAQRRAQSRYFWFDEQIVPNTGFETLDEHQWESLLSVSGAQNPRLALANLSLLADDDSGFNRATVAGILLCTQSPHNWLPQAIVMATCYRGKDRASGQLDAQEITGSLYDQVHGAVKFVIRNMRVGARKTPAREDLPQYSPSAVFEAVVNAIAHRDYSMSSQRIRLSMFKDRLEIESPGQLPNRISIESMESRQATRNEVIASIFGRFPVAGIPGSDHRRYLMERRGDGVSIIRQETYETSGFFPEYEVIDESCLVLRIPSAKIDLTPVESTVSVHAEGLPIEGVDVLAIFPNKTWLQSTTNESGEAEFNLYTSNLPMTVYAALPGYAAGFKDEWMPNQGGLLLELEPLDAGGSVIFLQGSGHLPGLTGRLNPIRDTSDRTYLYASNVAIEQGRQQPVPFRIRKPITLTDAHGSELLMTIVSIIGQTSLIEYRQLEVDN